MSKSIKLKDDTFIDSTGIVHEKQPLSDLLKNMKDTSGIIDINRTDLNSFTTKFIAGYGHNLTNSPLDNLNQGHLLSIPRHDAEGFVTQYFSPYPSNDVYIRKCENGTWGKWVLITKDYSGNEQIVGTWINGKPIYRKTFTSTSNEQNFNIPHGASIDTVVSIDGYYRMWNTTWFRLGCTYYLGNIEYLTALRVSGDNIEVSLGSWINRNSDMITHVTLEYTKTTD